MGVGMKFIHIADVHLGAKPDAGTRWSENRKKEIWTSFEKVLQTAKNEEIDLLLIAGDLFHRQPLTKELKELDYKLAEISPIRVVIIAGNHDYIEEYSNYLNISFAKNIYMLGRNEYESLTFEDINTTLYGLSYHKREIKESLYNHLKPIDEEGIHVLLAHGGDESHIPFDKERLKWSGFDYIALGHIHKPQIIFEDLMAYSGSLEPLDRNETGRHGYIIGEITSEKKYVQFVPFNLRSYIDVSCVMEESMTNSQFMEEIRETLRDFGDHNMFRLYLSGYKQLNTELDFYSLHHEFYITEIINEILDDFDSNQLYEENKENLLGQFIKQMKHTQVQNNQMDDLHMKALQYGVKAMLQTGVYKE